MHHSNMGRYFDTVRKRLSCENKHARGETMSAGLFREYCSKNNLSCVNQEVINWGGNILNDCFSLFTKDEDKIRYQTNYLENNEFDKEIEHINQLSKMYSRK